MPPPPAFAQILTLSRPTHHQSSLCARPRPPLSLPCPQGRPTTSMVISSPPPLSPLAPAIVVVDHGSKRAAANNLLASVAESVRLRGGTIPVFSAHMELCAPSIADAFDAAAAGGATHIILVPFFLAPGRHVTDDIPRLAEDAAARHPGLTFDVRMPIGTHPAIADVVLERAASAAVPAVPVGVGGV